MRECVRVEEISWLLYFLAPQKRHLGGVLLIWHQPNQRQGAPRLTLSTFVVLLLLCLLSRHPVFLLLVLFYLTFTLLLVSSPFLLSSFLFFLFYSSLSALFPFLVSSICPSVQKPLYFITVVFKSFLSLPSPCRRARRIPNNNHVPSCPYH